MGRHTLAQTAERMLTGRTWSARYPAPPDARFGPDAFAGRIGAPYTLAPLVTGELVSAEVVDEGAAVVLSFAVCEEYR